MVEIVIELSLIVNVMNFVLFFQDTVKTVDVVANLLSFSRWDLFSVRIKDFIFPRLFLPVIYRIRCNLLSSKFLSEFHAQYYWQT